MSEQNWEWWAGDNEEHFALGPFNSRDDAVANAGSYYYGNDGFFIIEAVLGSKKQLMPPAYMVIENALESAADDGAFGEDGDYDLSGTKEEQTEAFEALDKAIAEWLEKFGSVLPYPYRFDAQRNCEYIAAQQEQPK